MTNHIQGLFKCLLIFFFVLVPTGKVVTNNIVSRQIGCVESSPLIPSLLLQLIPQKRRREKYTVHEELREVYVGQVLSKLAVLVGHYIRDHGRVKYIILGLHVS